PSVIVSPRSRAKDCRNRSRDSRREHRTRRPGESARRHPPSIAPPGRPPLSFFERIIRQPLSRFLDVPAVQRSSTLRTAIQELNCFFDDGRSPSGRAAPQRTRTMAISLLDALRPESGEKTEAGQTLTDRIITDTFL